MLKLDGLNESTHHRDRGHVLRQKRSLPNLSFETAIRRCGTSMVRIVRSFGPTQGGRYGLDAQRRRSDTHPGLLPEVFRS